MAEPQQLQQPAPPVAAGHGQSQQHSVQALAQRQPKPWEQFSHPADRLAMRLSYAISKVNTKKLKKVINPIKAIKDRANKKREKRNAQARQQLQSILERGWPLAAEHRDEIVQLLRKKPFLAGEAFQESVSGHSTSPLSFLIAGGAPLSTIQEVLSLIHI